jgi:hypothetical protein
MVSSGDIPGLWEAEGGDLTLSLQEAERLVLMDDPSIAQFNAKAEALGQRAVAEGQLPDPKIRLGMLNFPTDTFDRSQEPMTQLLFGVQQTFPKGQSLSVKTRRTRALSSAQREQAENQKLVALREVRLSWLELYYWLGAEQVVGQNQDYFAQLVEVTQLQYAVGRHNQQDVIRAQLELKQMLDTQYVCPMHPQIIRDKPGNYPICGMELVPVDPTAETSSSDGPPTVRISPAVVNSMGVRTAPVDRGRLWRSIKTVGYVDYDESKLSHVHLRIEGWIERLNVRSEGKRVRKGVVIPAIFLFWKQYVVKRKNASESTVIATA